MADRAQPDLLDPETIAALDPWVPPTGSMKRVCSRRPDHGPGTCWLWWEGCPKAEKRGCHLLWQRRVLAVAAGRDPDTVDLWS